MRTHFVYRMYDTSGHLLYVGCTKNLELRLRNHRHENAHFFHRIAFIKQQGPLPRDRALALEKRLIRELRPDFNSTPDRRRRVAEKRRWIKARVSVLCDGLSPHEVEISEYLRLSDIAYSEAESLFPGIVNSRSPHPSESIVPLSA